MSFSLNPNPPRGSCYCSERLSPPLQAAQLVNGGGGIPAGSASFQSLRVLPCPWACGRVHSHLQALCCSLSCFYFTQKYGGSAAVPSRSFASRSCPRTGQSLAEELGQRFLKEQTDGQTGATQASLETTQASVPFIPLQTPNKAPWGGPGDPGQQQRRL